MFHPNTNIHICILTLNSLYTKKSYLRGGNKTHLSAIESSGEHPNGREIVARAATQAGLVYRVMGLVCKRSVVQIQGEPP